MSETAPGQVSNLSQDYQGRCRKSQAGDDILCQLLHSTLFPWEYLGTRNNEKIIHFDNFLKNNPKKCKNNLQMFALAPWQWCDDP